MLSELLPARRLRAAPRAVKRKMTNYAAKRPAHRNWPQPTRRAEDTVIILSLK
jgi:hypothetical protein